MLGEGREPAGVGRPSLIRAGGAGRREATAAILAEGTGDPGTLRQLGRVPRAQGQSPERWGQRAQGEGTEPQKQ